MTESSDLDIANILKEVYGLEHDSASPLSGYDDRNYLILCKSKFESCKNKKYRYVMKIINEVDSCKVGLTEAILTVMKSLPSMSFTIPRPCSCVNGELIWRLETQAVFYRNICLLSYVPGLEHQEICYNPDSLPKLCQNIGLCAGELASELFKINLNLLPALQRVGEVYSIENLYLARQKLGVVEDLGVRRICSEVMMILRDFQSGRKDGFRKSILHNDMCIENFIFYKNIGTDVEYSVAGIIDFSDMAISYCVFEAAIFVASAMYTSHFVAGSNLFVVSKSALSGFEAKFPLTKPEKVFLYNAVLGRFVSLRVLGGYDCSHSKQAAEHEMIDTNALDHCITMLSSLGEDKWNKAMGI